LEEFGKPFVAGAQLVVTLFEAVIEVAWIHVGFSWMPVYCAS
jgi:hypothetical protein